MSRDEALAVMGAPVAFDRDRLRARYRRLALRHHPDRNGGSAESFARFKRINQAYRVLAAELDRRSAGATDCPAVTCTRCGVRRAERRGLDRNPYCRECLVYAGGRRLLPAPPTVIATCTLTIAAHAVAVVALVLLYATRQPHWGTVALISAGAGLVLLAITAVVIGEVARRRRVR